MKKKKEENNKKKKRRKPKDRGESKKKIIFQLSFRHVSWGEEGKIEQSLSDSFDKLLISVALLEASKKSERDLWCNRIYIL